MIEDIPKFSTDKTICGNFAYVVLKDDNLLDIYRNVDSSEFFITKIDKNLRKRYYISTSGKNYNYDKREPSSKLSRIESWLADGWKTNGRWKNMHYRGNSVRIKKYYKVYPEEAI